MHQWYYIKAGMLDEQQIGPIDETELVSLIDKGKIGFKTRVSSPTRTKNAWMLAGSLPSIAQRIVQAEGKRKEKPKKVVATIDPPEPEPAPPPAAIPVERPIETSVSNPNQIAVNVAPVGSSPVQVNVHNESHSNSLGIASLILGLVSMVICWVPLVGLAFSGMGLILGVCALIASFTRGGKGIGYAIAGSFVSGFGVLIGGYVAIGILAPIQNAANEVRKKQAERTAEYVDSSKPFTIGDITLTIDSVELGKVPLESFSGETTSVDDFVTIWVTVANTSEGKKIDFLPWRETRSVFSDRATLKDNFDNSYRKTGFGINEIAGVDDELSIYPGKSVKEAIVFEVPVDSAKYLDLVLPADAVDQNGSFRFRIPMSTVRK